MIKDIRHTCRTCDYAIAMDAVFQCKLHGGTTPWTSARGCDKWKRRE